MFSFFVLLLFVLLLIVALYIAHFRRQLVIKIAILQKEVEILKRKNHKNKMNYLAASYEVSSGRSNSDCCWLKSC